MAEKTRFGVNIKISDNGLGINKGAQEKVFDIFYRENADKKGSGLGLYLVKNSVEKLNGTISLQSDKGVGTTIEISLPGA